MNVSSIYGALGGSALTSLGNLGAVGTSSASGSVPPPAAESTATISGPGQFFSEMEQLSQQNPAEFQAVAAQVATTFQNAASQASGPQAQFLTNLANMFSQAAQTGVLQPPQAAQGASGSQGTPQAQAAQTTAAVPPVQGMQANESSGGAAHRHHHHHGGGSAGQSSEVQQAFQSAISILNQAMQGTSTSTSSGSSTTA